MFNNFQAGISKFIYVCLAGLVIFSSCSDSNNSATPKYSTKIQKIVPDSIIKALEANGMNLNPGTNPPSIAGIYVASPYTLLSPYGPEDGYKKGRVIPDYRYKFYEQKGDEVKVDYKNVGTDSGSGIGAFLSGSGKKFSLFAELSGTAAGIPYKHLTVISGEMAGNGIKNFQYAFVLKEKTGDASNSILMPTGKSRIWIDGDSLASKVETFRQAFLESQNLHEGVGANK